MPFWNITSSASLFFTVSQLVHNMALKWFALGAVLNVCVLQSKGEEVSPDAAWGHSCPVICSCQAGHFADLPVNHWLHSEQSKTTTQSGFKQNEALYETEYFKDEFILQKERGDLLKIALCLFQSKSDSERFLLQLPRDTQALSILQGRSSEDIVLEEQHMKHLERLIFLDIEGYCPEARKDHTTNQSFAVSSNVLKPLKSLKYLSFQHVHILGSSLQSNQIDHEGESISNMGSLLNEISIDLQSVEARKARRHQKGLTHKLSFVTRDASDNFLPYKEYKREQEQARLSTFANLSNLLLLRIIDCGLHEVYWEMFEGMTKLEYLSLEKNQLLFLPEFAFYGTPNLKILSLAHNKLLTIQSTGLAGLLELKKLDLSHNKFSHLSEFSLPPFPKLETANFRHNPIEAVFASTFEIMNATTNLFLGGNDSTLALHSSSFLGLNNLRKLVLFNVEVDLLERQLLTGMPQLRELDMSGTISAISFDAFLDAPQLEKLILHGCQIKSLSMDAFYGLYKLLYLDLSNNLLEILPPGVFDQQFSLRELHLQNNKLTELPDGFFTTLPAKMVRLNGNLWHCSCIMKDWQPSATNRVKEINGPVCQNEYDKGNGCRYVTNYVYDRKVAPTCTTPSKYKGWSVYNVIRKELRCTKKHQNKFNRLEYLKKKHKEYEKNNAYNQKESDTSTGSHGIKKTVLKDKTDQILSLTNKTLTMTSHMINMSNVNFPSENHEQIINSTEIKQNKNLEDGKKNYNKIHGNENLENIIPLIPQEPIQNEHTDVKTLNIEMHNTEEKVSQNKITEAAHSKRKVGKEIVSDKYEMTNDHLAKALKKVWKEDLQRKHQEKLNSYLAQ